MCRLDLPPTEHELRMLLEARDAVVTEFAKDAVREVCEEEGVPEKLADRICRRIHCIPRMIRGADSDSTGAT